MADIAAGDVTYVMLNKEINESGMAEYNFTVAFGNGVLTYPAGGIPLTKASMGCPNEIRDLVISGPASANGFVYKYDPANNKVRIYQGDNDNVADAPLIELVAATATPAAATLYVNVKGW